MNEISLETVIKIINDVYDSYDIQAQGLSKDQVIENAIEDYVGGLKFM